MYQHELVTSVGLHVLIEVLLHVEVFAAPLTHELLVADVDAHMRSQLVLVLETFIAILQNTQSEIKQVLFAEWLIMKRYNTKHLPHT